MSAKTVTDNGGTGRGAVLRAIQEAAESAAGKNGVPKGPKGTRGIVVLSDDASWTDPEDKRKKKKGDEDDDEDEGSELSSIRPRALHSPFSISFFLLSSFFWHLHSILHSPSVLLLSSFFWHLHSTSTSI